MLSGSGSIKIVDEQALVKPGNVVFVPRNAWHGAETANEALSYLCLNTYIAQPTKYTEEHGKL